MTISKEIKKILQKLKEEGIAKEVMEFNTYAKARNWRDEFYKQTGKFKMIYERNHKSYIDL